jgi:hypothetical protein
MFPKTVLRGSNGVPQCENKDLSMKFLYNKALGSIKSVLSFSLLSENSIQAEQNCNMF